MLPFDTGRSVKFTAVLDRGLFGTGKGNNFLAGHWRCVLVVTQIAYDNTVFYIYQQMNPPVLVLESEA